MLRLLGSCFISECGINSSPLRPSEREGENEGGRRSLVLVFAPSDDDDDQCNDGGLGCGCGSLLHHEIQGGAETVNLLQLPVRSSFPR
jgi:hypothetical protein